MAGGFAIGGDSLSEASTGDDRSYDLLDIISDERKLMAFTDCGAVGAERILALAIDRMPKQERVVLSLYYYEELTLREIAEVMGMHLSRIGQLRVQPFCAAQSLERVWSTKRGMKR